MRKGLILAEILDFFFYQGGSSNQSQLYNLAVVAGEIAFLLALWGKTLGLTRIIFDLKSTA